MFARTLRASLFMPCRLCVCVYVFLLRIVISLHYGETLAVVRASPTPTLKSPATARTATSFVFSHPIWSCIGPLSGPCVIFPATSFFPRTTAPQASDIPSPPQPSPSLAPFPARSGQRYSRSSSCRPSAEVTYHVALA